MSNSKDVKEIELDQSSEIHDILSGTIDLLRESSSAAQNIGTIMVELDTIKRKYKHQDILKGDYEITKGSIIEKGTIYDKYESKLLKDILGISTDYWNPNWDFVSWKELFSKMDKIDLILLKIGTNKDELEEILLKSSEIKTRLDAIIKYIPAKYIPVP